MKKKTNKKLGEAINISPKEHPKAGITLVAME